jgi:hypothetical protein
MSKSKAALASKAVRRGDRKERKGRGGKNNTEVLAEPQVQDEPTDTQGEVSEPEAADAAVAPEAKPAKSPKPAKAAEIPARVVKEHGYQVATFDPKDLGDDGKAKPSAVCRGTDTWRDGMKHRDIEKYVAWAAGFVEKNRAVIHESISDIDAREEACLWWREEMAAGRKPQERQLAKVLPGWHRAA